MDIAYSAYDMAHLGESFDLRLYEAKRAVETLHVKCSELPKVDANGQSECSFAEECYAQKEAAAEDVRRLIPVFRNYLPAINAEVARIERDYMATGVTRDGLHGAEPRRKLTEAERKIEERRDSVIEQGRQATAMIRVMENAVAEADKKKWPLGEPMKSPYGCLGAGSPVSTLTDAQRSHSGHGTMADSSMWCTGQDDDPVYPGDSRCSSGELPNNSNEAKTDLPSVPGLRTELDALLGCDGRLAGAYHGAEG